MKKRMNLVRYFLQNSPLSRHRQLKAVIPSSHPPSVHHLPTLPTDKQYLQKFLNNLELFQVETRTKPYAEDVFKGLLKRGKMSAMRQERWEKEEPSNRFLELLGNLSSSGVETLTNYQEAEQWLAICEVSLIIMARHRLVYLFKLLLTRREWLPYGLQREANLELNQCIIAALTRAEKSDVAASLQAMVKLQEAKEHRAAGRGELALEYFAAICTDAAAPPKTRLEALKALCEVSEQRGETERLEWLAGELKGEEYESCLTASLTRIREQRQ